MDTIYHIYNRGVEKRTIFLDDRDRIRFINSLAIFNSSDLDPNVSRTMRNTLMTGVRLQSDDQLVEIMAFCLMPNHFHLMMRARTERGISKFMQKLGTGYANYFNLRRQRVGSLFQNKYKSVPIMDDAHFLWLPHYIHCNPAKKNDWSPTSVKGYRWSSYGEYAEDAGNKRYPEIIDTTFLSEIFETPENFRKQTQEWLKSYSESEADGTNALVID